MYIKHAAIKQQNKQQSSVALRVKSLKSIIFNAYC